MSDKFSERFGFKRNEVTLANWRETPYSTFSFFHVGEIVPSVVVSPARSTTEIQRALSDGFLEQKLEQDGAERSVKEYLEFSNTDVFLLWRDGALKAEYAAPHASLSDPHIVFSISKSISGILAGILEDQGVLELNKPVSYYLPDMVSSGFGDCSLRNLLDMRVSLQFEESYLNADGDYARYRRATNWNPTLGNETTETLAEFLSGLQKGAHAHGGAFHYLSPASDLLGLILEKAGGVRYSELLSKLLWEPLGAKYPAYMTVDLLGAPRSAGGISVVAEDLLRIGMMLLGLGRIDGRKIISKRWVDDMLNNGNEQAWNSGNFHDFVVGGRYRSQWYRMPRGCDAFFGVGIHGQWLYVDRKSNTIVVKLSSQPIPQDDTRDQMNFDVFEQLCTMSL